MKVMFAICHNDVGDIRFAKPMDIPDGLLHKGQRILTMINGNRESALITEVDLFEEGVALVYAEMADSLYAQCETSESWDKLVRRFKADVNWKQYGQYFEDDPRMPDGPMDHEVLALLKS